MWISDCGFWVLEWVDFCKRMSRRFLFELGMKEFEGIKDTNVGFFAKNNVFTSLIPSNSFIPNSNKKRRAIRLQKSTHSEIRNPKSEIVWLTNFFLNAQR
jgi:hypothetical protein